MMTIPGFAGRSPLEVGQQAVKNFLDDDMMTHAAALAFRVLLALFPFVIVLLSLLGAMGRTEFFDWLVGQAQLALPPQAAALVTGVLSEIREQPRDGLVSFSLLFALWAASAGVRALMNTLNVAYDVREARPAWQRYPLSLLYTVGLALLLIAALALMVLGPNVIQWLSDPLGLSGVVTTLWIWLRWPLAVLLLLLTFALIYKLLPNIDQPFRFVTPGAVIAVVVWLLASLGFTAYVANFGNYSATYGSLGGIIILLMYLFLSAAVFLFGAEINATIYPAHIRQGAGNEKPVGASEGRRETISSVRTPWP